MTAKKIQAAIFKTKFGVNQHDIVLRISKQRHKRRIFFPTLQN